MKIAKIFLISGRVQGVGFRYFAEHAARQLGISGYVKNLDDGRVEVYAIGERPALEALRSRLAKGPHSARVTAVEESEEAVNSEYKSFGIEGGW